MTTKTDVLRIKFTVDGNGNVVASLGGIEKATGGLDKQLKKTQSTAKQVKQALAAIGAAALVRAAVNTITTYERLDATLVSLTGSAPAAAATLAALTGLAGGSGNTVESLTQSYIRLKSFGLDPLDGSLQSIIDQNAALGGSQETLRGLILGVGQAWAKQKLQGEEILQLLERGVPVWDILARKLGKTARELQVMSEKGELGRREIRLLIDEMGNLNAGAAAKQADTLGGALTVLSDSIAQAIVKLSGESGLTAALKHAAQASADFVNNLAGNRNLAQVQREIAEITRYLDLMGKQSAQIRFMEGSNIERKTRELAALNKELAQFKKQAAATGTKTAVVADEALTAKQLASYKKMYDDVVNYTQSAVDAVNEIESEHLFNIEELYNNEIISWEEKERLKSDIQAQADADRLEASRQSADEWGKMWQATLDRFAAGVGDAVADVILEHVTLEEAARQVLKNVARQVISSMVEIAIKKAFFAQQERAQRAAVTAELSAEGGTVAVAWAPAAAATSLASFGGNSVPAQAGIASTYALTSSLSLGGVAHGGLDEVPREGTYLLQGKELVAKPREGERLRKMMDRLESGGAAGGADGGVHFHFPYAIDPQAAAKVVLSQRGAIIGMVQEYNESRGRAA